MFFNKNSNLKLYIFVAVCMVIILAMWFYTLKLNLSKPWDLGPSFTEIFSGLENSNILKQESQILKEPNKTKISQDLIDKLAGELKSNEQEVQTSDEMQ
ncbi:MAG: hypothetical protein ABIF17_00195 [Patescibacteria group bacterium]